MNSYFSRLAKFTGLQIGPRRAASRSPFAPPVASPATASPATASLEAEEMRLLAPPRVPELASPEAAFPGVESRPAEQSVEPPRVALALDLSQGFVHSPEAAPARATWPDPQVKTPVEPASSSSPMVEYQTIERTAADAAANSWPASSALPLPPPAAGLLQATVRIGEATADSTGRSGEAIAGRMKPEAEEIEVKEERISPPRSSWQRPLPGQLPQDSGTPQLIASWQDVQEWVNAAPDAPEFSNLVRQERTIADRRRPVSSLEIPELGDPAAANEREPGVQDFQLSIGNISIVVESPTPAVAPPPRVSQSPEPKREVSRLSRHYIQGR